MKVQVEQDPLPFSEASQAHPSKEKYSVPTA